MKGAVIQSLILCSLAALAAASEAPQAPPVPAPPSGPVADRPPSPMPMPLPPDPAMPDATRETARANDGSDEPKSRGDEHEDEKKPRSHAPPKIILRDKSEIMNPSWQGAGMSDWGKIVVKGGESTLTATLSGSAFAHSWIGGSSASRPTFQLVQEFEVAPGDPKDPRVVLTLSGKLDGYIRSTSRGTACLRRADAAVHPACGGPALTLAFPPSCTPDRGAWRYEQEVHPPSLTLPAGRFVLVVNLVPEATTEGLLGSHAEAVFSPSPRQGTWDLPLNPLEPIDDKDFGLAITLKVAAP